MILLRCHSRNWAYQWVLGGLRYHKVSHGFSIRLSCVGSLKLSCVSCQLAVEQGRGASAARYNLRVVECRLAAVMLALALEAARPVQTFNS
jgi:hypothetical protein